jgi:EAL domain-containing protein (putative c-di-GMP-specific phosphodiesterase class I)
VITLAHRLGMDVVAEGIETPTQLRLLKNLGCEFGQGYLFAKPLPMEDAVMFIENWRSHKTLTV